jgi:hypothetical protein
MRRIARRWAGRPFTGNPHIGRRVVASSTMSSDQLPAMEVFGKALMLVLAAGAAEIGIDTLLCALDDQPTPGEPVRPATGPFLPVERRELPLSPAAAAVVSSLGNMFSIRLDVLRTALIAAKRGEQS